MNDLWFAMSYPSVVQVGEQYTILGFGFGDEEGTLRIEIEFDGQVIEPDVWGWQYNSIHFLVPQTAERIPFNARAKLFISVKGSENTHRPLNITVEPLSVWYFSDKYKYSDDGMNLSDSLSFVHNFTKTFKSPSLPSSYKLTEHPIFEIPGLLFEYSSNEYRILDEPAIIEIDRGMTVSDNRLEVTGKVTDDWHWDYIIVVEFFIYIPNGFDTTGWST